MEQIKNAVEKVNQKLQGGNITELKKELLKIQKCKRCEREENLFRLENGLCSKCTFQDTTRESYFKPKPNPKYFEDFKVNKKNRVALELSKKFIENDRGIFLYGSVGAGKTHLCYAAYNEFVKNYRYPYFVILPELLLEIRNSFRDNSTTSEDEIIGKITSPKWLFIDDFGAEKISDFSIEVLYLIFSRRERSSKNKIFITSNFDLERIASTMSDRIASRIVGMCDIVKLEDYDHRIK